MMMRKKIILLISICWAVIAQAQQRPVQSLYMFDPLLINPAYAGNHVQLSSTLIYRNQWVNLPGAPKTVTATVHSGFKDRRFGLGLLFGSDQIGVHNDNSMYLAYSFKIPLNTYTGASLSWGLQGGFNNVRSDYAILNPKDPDIYGSITIFNPNFGGGLYYRDKINYIGISVPYILNSKLIDSSIGQLKQYRYYYINAGTILEINKIVKFKPSALVRIQEHAPISFDINGMWVFHDVASVGASYRYKDSLIGLFELQLNTNFHVGYAYDITTSALHQYSNGSHELMINYRVKISRIHKGIECPSYFH